MIITSSLFGLTVLLAIWAGQSESRDEKQQALLEKQNKLLEEINNRAKAEEAAEAARREARKKEAYEEFCRTHPGEGLAQLMWRYEKD